eukprot:TRINITY_DN48872_c0_g1_i1.p1 TRINITY_DN48872_c0_g1~~TRINITY_DN48872_c0_g1_i1.p1  ORF type:complete len:193 (+),score=26.17 TRINITY_DN48872_c0_g1_i1:82-579(+)
MPMKIEKMQRQLTRSMSTPDHVWWGGCQDAAAVRDFGDIDGYHIMDRTNTVGSTLSDRRYRRLDCQDKTRCMIFGPTPGDFDKGKKLMNARPSYRQSDTKSYSLDKYAWNEKNTFVTKDKSRRLEFQPAEERFTFRKGIGRDFTSVGWATNVVRTDIRGDMRRTI